MSKSGDWYLQKMEEQFGDVLVGMDCPCRYCGQRYGDHHGLDCPESFDISPYETPYSAYDKEFSPTNEESK